ncbi:MAG: hypothetical protein ACTSYM_05595 [Candidatus Baldrarchaeia archaeon]
MAKGKVAAAVLGFLAASLFYGEQINYYYGVFAAFLKENLNLAR